MLYAFRSHRLLYFLSFGLLFRFAASNGSGTTSAVTWIYPSNPEAFNAGDTLDAAWTSTYESPFLTLNCKQNQDGILKQRHSGNVSATGDLSIVLNFLAVDTLICNLGLTDLTNPDGAQSTSPTFSVSKAVGTAPQTWAAPISALSSIPPSTATVSAIVRTVTASASTSAPTPSTQPSSGGISTAEGVGIGIGVAVGCIFLIVGAMFFYLHRRRRRKLDTVGVKSDSSSDAPEVVVANQLPRLLRVLPVAGVHESPGSIPTITRFELDGGPIDRPRRSQQVPSPSISSPTNNPNRSEESWLDED